MKLERIKTSNNIKLRGNIRESPYLLVPITPHGNNGQYHSLNCCPTKDHSSPNSLQTFHPTLDVRNSIKYKYMHNVKDPQAMTDGQNLNLSHNCL